ncbi:MAG: serine hydrolase [Candidatus Thorarchaeota archaeon]|nr:serine hydrolase [Candidatus Thorarchaeota archaeon]
MDGSMLQAMIDHIIDEDLDVHSVIVIRNGYVVLEEYPNPFQGQSRTQSFDGTHYLYSTTKSFTSCMVGIAIDKGFLDNTSQKVLSIFTDMTFDNVDERKERITIDDLLTMRSGLPWDETSAPFNSPDNDVWQVNFNSSGGVQFVLDQPMEDEPGVYFHYNTGASHVLSGIVHEVTNMSMLEFADENLFTPLGIDRFLWPSDTQGVTFGGFDLQLRPLDMAKFGFLFLNNGTWDGEQIVSSDWVHNTTTTVTTLNSISGYSRQWWTMPDYGVYHTAGLYGQYIFVAPELDIVAVFTSGYGANDVDENPQMVRDYILSAVLGYEPPDSPGGFGIVPQITIAAFSLVAVVLIVQYVRRRR